MKLWPDSRPLDYISTSRLQFRDLDIPVLSELITPIIYVYSKEVIEAMGNFVRKQPLISKWRDLQMLQCH